MKSEKHSPQNRETDAVAKPFVKWAGGKNQLLDDFQSYYPPTRECGYRYHEPFAGGGAVFFHLHNQDMIQKAFLNDSNPELMNAYRVVKKDVDSLIERLTEHAEEFECLGDDYYYEVRSWDRDPEMKLSSVEKAARFIFLNRTCYNGLYRVNSRGEFNVPVGRYSNPRIVFEGRLQAVHRALQTVHISQCDFEIVLKNAQPGDFVYFDPPYVPLNDTSYFTSYTKDSFGPDDQKRLAQTYRQLNRRGCYVMLSNSDTEFVKTLYEGFLRRKVDARRSINSRGDSRGDIKEVVVLNYYPADGRWLDEQDK